METASPTTRVATGCVCPMETSRGQPQIPPSPGHPLLSQSLQGQSSQVRATCVRHRFIYSRMDDANGSEGWERCSCHPIPSTISRTAWLVLGDTVLCSFRARLSCTGGWNPWGALRSCLNSPSMSLFHGAGLRMWGCSA